MSYVKFSGLGQTDPVLSLLNFNGPYTEDTVIQMAIKVYTENPSFTPYKVMDYVTRRSGSLPASVYNAGYNAVSPKAEIKAEPAPVQPVVSDLRQPEPPARESGRAAAPAEVIPEPVKEEPAKEVSRDAPVETSPVMMDPIKTSLPDLPEIPAEPLAQTPPPSNKKVINKTKISIVILCVSAILVVIYKIIKSR